MWEVALLSIPNTLELGCVTLTWPVALKDLCWIHKIIPQVFELIKNKWLSHGQSGYNFWLSVQVFGCPYSEYTYKGEFWLQIYGCPARTSKISNATILWCGIWRWKLQRAKYACFVWLLVSQTVSHELINTKSNYMV